MAKNTRWDRNLSVAADAEGLVGHAGAVLRRCFGKLSLSGIHCSKALRSQ